MASPLSSSQSSSSTATTTSSSLSSSPSFPTSPTPHQQYDEEVTLEVPHEFMEFPLGFVIDAGGSVIKLLYRSNTDYHNGKLIKPSDHGFLHMKHFNMADIWRVNEFLKLNCDVIPNENNLNIHWWMTGVMFQHVKVKLEEDFGIKTKLQSRKTAMQWALQSMESLNIGFYEWDPVAVASTAKMMRLMVQTIEGWMKIGDETLEIFEPSVESTNVGSNKNTLSELSAGEESSILPKLAGPVVDLIAASDVRDWIGKYLDANENCIRAPSVIVLFGSSIDVLLVDDALNVKRVDYLEVAGKTLCGLVEEILRETDFDRFMEMAEQGNSDNVCCLASDLRNYDHKEEDWYSIFPDDAAIFELGQLTSGNAKGKGNYSNEDLAAGLLSFQTKIISKFALLQCRVHNVETAYFCGSIVKYGTARRMIQKHFLADSLMLSLEGVPIIKIHFLQHPGFLLGLGVWAANVEKAKCFEENE